MERAAADYGVSKIEDLYAALGYGKFSARQALQKLAPQLVKEEQLELPKVGAAQPAAGAPPPGPHDGDAVIRVKGVDDLLVYRAKCCNPIRGEVIVGYVTRGKGIAVHSKTCPNVQNLLYDVERKIDVEWARNTAETFPVKMVVHTDDRPGLLAQITSMLSNENTNIRTLEARTEVDNADGALIEMTVDVRDKKQLERLVAAMRRISGIRDVERLLN
jgi:GTP pyrophosphokinase